jgi:serine protease Do
MAIGAIVLTLVASLAVATPATAQVRASVRTQEPDSLVLIRGELQRLVQSQQALVRDILWADGAARRASSASERNNFRLRVAELSARLDRALSESELLQAHLRAICAERPAPDGWLGINISETIDITASPSATTFVFRKYPTLVSVEPGSPAQKAGLASGDEILALAGRDMVSGAIDIGSLLKAGTALHVRYRRAGEQRMVNVLIEPRPEGFNANCPWIEINRSPAIAAMRPKLRVFELPSGGVGYAFTTDSTGPKVLERASAQVRGTPVLPPTPYAPFRLQGTVPGTNRVVAGAVLMPLSEQLRDGLGLDQGILVYDVLNGSPALEAGLRAGDVILSVNGQKVQSILALEAALTRDRVVELQVSRRNAKRSVSLRP